MINDNWIEDLLKKSKLNTNKEEKNYINPLESDFIVKLIDECYRIHKVDPIIPLGKFLPALLTLWSLPITTLMWVIKVGIIARLQRQISIIILQTVA